MIYNLPFIAVALLIVVGLYAVIFRRNLIKIVIGITIIESGVNLFLITLAFRDGIKNGKYVGSSAPIYTGYKGGEMAMPVPHALTLTSIVIGVAVLALMLTLVIHLYRHYNTLDSRKIGGETK